jgi:hypothetical protein
MKKFALGFIMGGVVCAAILVPVLRNLDYGERRRGLTEARREVAGTLKEEFGTYDGYSPYNVLFSVKTTDVISVEKNGVKTIRIIP